MHSICPDIDGDDGLGNIQDFVHTHVNAGMSDDAFQFLINLVCHEADTDVCLYPPFCEVEYGAHLQIPFADPECFFHYL